MTESATTLLLNDVVDGLEAFVERINLFLAGHQRRVSALACAVAAELGLEKRNIEALRIAGLLHDIGHICIPSQIMSSPRALDDEEFRMIRTHPRLGADILRDMKFPPAVFAIVLDHHEKYDGSGYPRGRKGAEIPPEARVLAVAEVVEAMVSNRPYRPVSTRRWRRSRTIRGNCTTQPRPRPA